MSTGVFGFLRSALDGVAGILDFANTLRQPWVPMRPDLQDRLALASDWKAVGADLVRALTSQACNDVTNRDLKDRRIEVSPDALDATMRAVAASELRRRTAASELAQRERRLTVHRSARARSRAHLGR